MAEWVYVLCAGVLCTLRQRRRRRQRERERESSFEGMTHRVNAKVKVRRFSRSLALLFRSRRAAWCVQPLHSTLSLAGQAKFLLNNTVAAEKRVQSCEQNCMQRVSCTHFLCSPHTSLGFFRRAHSVRAE